MKQITIDGVTYNLSPVQDDVTYDLIPVQDEELLICTLDGFDYYLGPEAPSKMNWKDAITWCKSLGDNYELPNRYVLLILYGHSETIRNKIKTDGWYWSSTEFSAMNAYVTFAWTQTFVNGGQNTDYKDGNNYVRAVRKV